jgi:hypothetical protein
MEKMRRQRFSREQKTKLWERWESGQCPSDIARALERKTKGGVYRILALYGGIVPVTRRRCLVVLVLAPRRPPKFPQ